MNLLLNLIEDKNNEWTQFLRNISEFSITYD